MSGHVDDGRAAGAIDFHSLKIRGTYASRAAGEDWLRTIRDLIDPHGATVADIGCGGGIYSRAWSELGASRVIGIDFSDQMINDAISASAGYPSLSFSQGEAASTELPASSIDIVFERALIHHLTNLEAAFTEAHRILKPGGTLIVQDRTMQDVLHPSSKEHFRGYFFETFPRLLEVEQNRRPDTATVAEAMERSGFKGITTQSIPETRRTYASLDELQEDLRARTGRSILHELTDSELDHLITTISDRLHDSFPLAEIDSWTIWIGRTT